MGSAGEQVVLAAQARLADPGFGRVARGRGDLELHRALGPLLVFFYCTVARLATCSPWPMSRTFSDTRSHARSLLSKPMLSSARSRERCSCCSRIRMAQMSLGLNGAFALRACLCS